MAVSRALNLLEHAVARTSALRQDHRKIALRVWPTLGAPWLMSRLAQLPTAELWVEVEVSIGVDGNADVEAKDIDAVILHGTGQPRELTAYRIIDEELVAVTEP
jgi:DNA-binding transcriptional LysR family regulator